MILLKKYNYNGKVTSKSLHEVLVQRIEKCTTDLDERLFAMLCEITNIARSNIMSGGFRNLDDADWQDVKIAAIEHAFRKTAAYDSSKMKSCYNFLYTVISNKMRDLVKMASFKRYIYDSVGSANDFSTFDMSCDNMGRSNAAHTSHIRPLTRFNNSGYQNDQTVFRDINADVKNH